MTTSVYGYRCTLTCIWKLLAITVELFMLLMTTPMWKKFCFEPFPSRYALLIFFLLVCLLFSATKGILYSTLVFVEAQRGHPHNKVGRMKWSWNREMCLEFEAREVMLPDWEVRGPCSLSPGPRSSDWYSSHPVVGVDLGEVFVCSEIVGDLCSWDS